MAIDTSYGLFMHNLKAVYYLERRLVDELEGMAMEATDDRLSSVLMEHMRETEDQVERLQMVFNELGVAPVEHEAYDFKGIFDEAAHVNSEINDVDLANLAFLGMARKVEHIEISSYETLLVMADRFDMDDEVEDLLEENLREEKAALEELENIAEKSWVEKLIDKLNP